MTLRVRLNHVDHYQSAPTLFDPPVHHGATRSGNVFPKLPVVRVFGATPSGQKVCVHVHGMFPYLYIGYDGSTVPDEVEAHLHQLRISIDYAMGVNLRRKADHPSFVAHISLVKGVPFYGYHVGYRLFLKIYLFNPQHIVRLADLLRQGTILSRAIQPFESHMQYVPQWMCDFNLFGCDYMDCETWTFRSPVPREDDVDNPALDWHDGSINPSMIMDERLPRQSHCALEVDVCVWHIGNRKSMTQRPLHHQFLEALTATESDEKLVTSMAGLWRDETRRRKARLGLDDDDSTPFPPEVLVSVSADPRNQNAGGWIHEDMFRDQVHKQVIMERSQEDSKEFSAAAVRAQNPDLTVPTTFESITDLFPPNLIRTNAAREAARERSSQATQSQREEIDVDEQQLATISDSLEDDQLPPGVRNAGDYEDEDRDLFEVPRGYTSDIYGAIERFESLKRAGELDRRESKRHKIIQDAPNLDRSFESASEPFADLPPSTQPNSRMVFGAGSQMTESSGESNHQNLATSMIEAFDISDAANLFVLDEEPPLADNTLDDLADQGIAAEIYQEAHYSRQKDVPDRSRIYGGREFKVPGNTLAYLPDFDPTGLPPLPYRRGARPVELGPDAASCTLRTWELAEEPPSWEEITDWLDEKPAPAGQNSQSSAGIQLNPASQIEAPTQKHKYGWKYSQAKPSKNITVEAQYMSVMSVEVHVNCRGELLPNPEFDEVTCVVWCLQSEHGGEELEDTHQQLESGIIIRADPDEQMPYRVRRDSEERLDTESSELEVINRLVDIVRDFDPDILTGFEVHDGSWGYLIERARRKYDFSLCDELSRIKSDSHGRFGREADRWGFNQTSTVHVTGRHVINIWRAMRGELDLLQYTLENVTFHVLHRRVPHYTHADLTRWWTSGRPFELDRVLDYWMSRAKIDLEILQRNELVARTSEQARLLGVDFYAVFARGSQFKVESLMSRIAKPESFILISPSRKQVGQQNALECLPMVMEPRSDFYASPVLVLDFQSLYPSVMIAYNYCYSTFLGRVVSWRGQNKMGFTDYERAPGLLEALENNINIAPNGMMFAKPEVRKSLLAKMLAEILETRVMVKSGMKVDKDDRQLHRLLNNRQLALKLIANVTYGYTSASFSGRMPCSEIADSIVQTGRETLERSIVLIHSVRKWRAEVVYGDTDSLFVLLRGRTREQAFAIGREIADHVTEMNPRPVKLKFEKVYHPCVLLAKKRYVGFKYESPDQVEPEFDAKGIETVRRDGTPAEQKIEETALKLMFRTADLSQVKEFVQRQFRKIMQGRVSVQDFCFAREVKLGTYSDRGPPPPGALIATRKMLNDPRAEPQYGERVPYVVITGAPGARLIDRCVAPEVLLNNDHYELDAEYYISKNLIPPLERIFNLVGANVKGWYEEMPKVQRIRRIVPPSAPQQLQLSEKRPAAGAHAGSALRNTYPNGPTVRGGQNLRGGPSGRARGGIGAMGSLSSKQGQLNFGASTSSAPSAANSSLAVKRTLESYMVSTTCVLCRARCDEDANKSQRKDKSRRKGIGRTTKSGIPAAKNRGVTATATTTRNTSKGTAGNSGTSLLKSPSKTISRRGGKTGTNTSKKTGSGKSVPDRGSSKANSNPPTYRLAPIFERARNRPSVGSNLRTSWVPNEHAAEPQIDSYSNNRVHRNEADGDEATMSAAQVKQGRSATTQATTSANKRYDPSIPLCRSCQAAPGRSLFALHQQLNSVEKRTADIEAVCRSCADLPFGEEVRCDSKDCPVFYSRVKMRGAEARERAILRPVLTRLEENLDREALEW